MRSNEHGALLQCSSTNQLVSEWFGNDTSLTNTHDPQRLWLDTAAVNEIARHCIFLFGFFEASPFLLQTTMPCAAALKA